MDIEFCYIVESGCVYEGGSVDVASLDFDKVVEYCLNLIKEKQVSDDRQNDRMLKHHIEYALKHPESYGITDPEKYKGEDYVPSKKKWEEEEDPFSLGKYWSNGMDFISIRKEKFIKFSTIVHYNITYY